MQDKTKKPKATTATRARTRLQRAREQAEQMVAIIEWDNDARRGGGRPLTLTEQAQASVVACEKWWLYEKAHHAMVGMSGDEARLILPALIALVAPHEPHYSETFADTFAARRVRNSRRELKDILRTGITDHAEWTRHQMHQQAARNILKKDRGETTTVRWEGDALSGIGIQDGDEIIVVLTPDIEPGDLVCTTRPAWMSYMLQTPDEVNLGVLRIQDSTLVFEYPNTDKKSDSDDLCEVKFVGRAVQVMRAGQPVDVPFAFRPYNEKGGEQ